MPDSLLKFIADGVGVLYKNLDLKSWTGTKKGSPVQRYANDFLSMLAWYRFYIDPRFNKIPKSPESGRWAVIAESLNIDDIETMKASQLDERDVDCINSETSVKVAVKNFQREGLAPVEFLHENSDNEGQVEHFCHFVLNETINTDCDFYFEPKSSKQLDFSIYPSEVFYLRANEKLFYIHKNQPVVEIRLSSDQWEQFDNEIPGLESYRSKGAVTLSINQMVKIKFITNHAHLGNKNLTKEIIFQYWKSNN